MFEIAFILISFFGGRVTPDVVILHGKHRVVVAPQVEHKVDAVVTYPGNGR